MEQYNWTTSSKVIKAEVNTLQTEFLRLLGQNLLGIYLHGSLALGGFQPARSDIDVIAVTGQGTDLEVSRTLVELLLRISKMPCPLDIYFLVEQDIFPFQRSLPYDLHYSEAEREQYQQELRNGTWKHWHDSVQRTPQLTICLTVLHHYGICLYGKPIAEAFPSVPEQAFRAQIIEDVRVAEDHRRQDPISFVLNACRVAAYLDNGTILSKDSAGDWGLANLPEQYHSLIEQSLALYRGDRLGRPPGRVVLDDFATYIHEAIQTERFPEV